MMIEFYPNEEGEEEAVWKHYDPACARLDTAIKAIWLLYRRARWSLLQELTGMTRRDLETVFGQFDMTHVASDHGRLRTESQVFALLRMFNQEVEVEEESGRRFKRTVVRMRKVNALLAAAMQMVLDYEYMFAGSRKVNHGRPREQSGGVRVERGSAE